VPTRAEHARCHRDSRALLRLLHAASASAVHRRRPKRSLITGRYASAFVNEATTLSPHRSSLGEPAQRRAAAPPVGSQNPPRGICSLGPNICSLLPSWHRSRSCVSPAARTPRHPPPKQARNAQGRALRGWGLHLAAAGRPRRPQGWLIRADDAGGDTSGCDGKVTTITPLMTRVISGRARKQALS
jgi:hypothetical protein